MRVLVTGATGMVGRRLVRRLLADGHAVTAWVRSPASARELLGPQVVLVPCAAGTEALRDALGGCDAVTNLAGEPVLPARWTDERKALLRESRVGVTNQLVQAMAAASPRPGTLVSASAVGFYGNRAEEVVDETSPPGCGFLADLCQDWEAAAARAKDAGARVAILRLGIVLDPSGGMLGSMVPVFRLGLGGPVGSGRQRVPWVHVEDLIDVIVAALRDPRFDGPINVTAVRSITNTDFARALGRAIGRPAIVPFPALAVRLALGEAADAMLGGHRVDPRRLRELGHPMRFATVEEALRDLLPAAS
jgi:hypothetical protein